MKCDTFLAVPTSMRTVAVPVDPIREVTSRCIAPAPGGLPPLPEEPGGHKEEANNE